jgi:two-component system, OmpR family, phosphate regulon sensor histidine kinase PhoR
VHKQKVLVYADWQRISQVMTNLISNAIKHSHDGSDVKVSFQINKKSIITHVIDSGVGIPEEDQIRIFERFYRVDKSRSREKGGTGLGLAIVKHILDGHNSKAEVVSELGKGSTFSFKLPRVKPDGTEPADSPKN